MPSWRYVDADLNTLDLPALAECVYARGDEQDKVVPYWLLTPLTYFCFWHRLVKAETAHSLGMMPGEEYYDMVMKWEPIDAHAREAFSEVRLEAARKAYNDAGLKGELPKTPDLDVHFMEPDEMLAEADDDWDRGGDQ
jgi:hypothetical protein